MTPGATTAPLDTAHPEVHVTFKSWNRSKVGAVGGK